MYYSKQIYSPTRKIKKMVTRTLGARWRTVLNLLVEYAPKIKSLIPEKQSLIPATKVFVGNNWLVMLKTSFTVLALLVFSISLINAENFQAYEKVALANGSWLAEQEIQESNDIAIDLESADADVELDDDGNVSKFTYTVRPKDTISGIASQFGVTTKNLRKVNKLAENAVLKPGTKLTITAVEWIVVTNQLGKVTVKEYASHYGLDLEDLKQVNNYDSDLTVLEKDYEIFVPITEEDALRVGLIKEEPKPIVLPKPKPSQPKPSMGWSKPSKKWWAYFSKAETAWYLWFAAYNCTSYVARKLPGVAKAIRAEGWGHAREWYGQAIDAGLKTGKTPSVGAVGVMGTTYGRYWHVGIVTSVGDNEVCMKNANVRWLGVVSEDCFPKKAFIGYIYWK